MDKLIKRLERSKQSSLFAACLLLIVCLVNASTVHSTETSVNFDQARRDHIILQKTVFFCFRSLWARERMQWRTHVLKTKNKKWEWSEWLVVLSLLHYERPLSFLMWSVPDKYYFSLVSRRQTHSPTNICGIMVLILLIPGDSYRGDQESTF